MKQGAKPYLPGASPTWGGGCQAGQRALDWQTRAASTLGQLDYEHYCATHAGWLKASGANKEAKRVEDTWQSSRGHHPLPKSPVGRTKVAAE